jgi:hypothetical protein
MRVKIDKIYRDILLYCALALCLGTVVPSFLQSDVSSIQILASTDKRFLAEAIASMYQVTWWSASILVFGIFCRVLQLRRLSRIWD